MPYCHTGNPAFERSLSNMFHRIQDWECTLSLGFGTHKESQRVLHLLQKEIWKSDQYAVVEYVYIYICTYVQDAENKVSMLLDLKTNIYTYILANKQQNMYPQHSSCLPWSWDLLAEVHDCSWQNTHRRRYSSMNQNTSSKASCLLAKFATIIVCSVHRQDPSTAWNLWKKHVVKL